MRLPRSPLGVYYRALRRVERRSRWAIATDNRGASDLLIEAVRLANRLYLADQALR